MRLVKIPLWEIFKQTNIILHKPRYLSVHDPMTINTTHCLESSYYFNSKVYLQFRTHRDVSHADISWIPWSKLKLYLHEISTVRLQLDRIHSGTGSPELCWVCTVSVSPGSDPVPNWISFTGESIWYRIGELI